MTIDSLYAIYCGHPSVQTDTRKLKPGDMFFALKGPHFNGNLFASKSLEMGAAFAVVDEAPETPDDRIIVVEDVLETLQALARHHRDQFEIPFLAITGSNGKTTTKELVTAVLRTCYKTYATEGNLNNHIGIPLTLLKIGRDAEIAVVEMGANHQGEIASYCRVVNPTHGLITNVGKAHLEGFGGVEGVKKGKGELFDHLRAHGGTAFACRDFEYFGEMTRGITEVVWYGKGDENDTSGTVINSDPFLTMFTGFAGVVTTQLVGEYNCYNVLAAIAVGKHFATDARETAKAVENYRPTNARSQLIREDTNTFILDAYNANPSSMEAAIENFAGDSAKDKVLMLGAMMELGPESIEEHRRIVELVGRYHWTGVVLVGGDFARIEHPYLYFPDAVSAGGWLNSQGFSHTHFLVKGSRAIAMEKILAR